MWYNFYGYWKRVCYTGLPHAERSDTTSEKKKGRYTEAQNRATQKYIREKLEEIKFRVRRGEKDKYKATAERARLSTAKFFLAAADEKIVRDGLAEGSSLLPGINPGAEGK